MAHTKHTMKILYTPMNRFRFLRSIKDGQMAVYAEKIFCQIDFSPEQLDDLKTLHRYATTLHRLDENSCNGWPTKKVEYRDGKMFVYDVEDTKWREKDERREEKIRQYIEAIEKANGWKVELQGDPRGWPMKLTIQNIDCSVLVNY